MATGLLVVVTSVALLLRPPGAGAPAAALRAPALRRAPRLGAPPRCADDDDDEKYPPLGGPLFDEEVEGGEGGALAEEELEQEFVRPPPAYPEGLHDPAKADRSGPFWSSLGEPDESTGVRPDYLRRDDWHISSTYTAEERTAVDDAERAYIDSVTIEMPEDLEEEEEEEDPFAEKEYMKLEPGPPQSGAQKSALPMPQSWQEDQALQGQMVELGRSESALGDAQRAAAEQHVEKLADFYPTFKDILAGGWELLNNKEIEDAVAFVSKHGK